MSYETPEELRDMARYCRGLAHRLEDEAAKRERAQRAHDKAKAQTGDNPRRLHAHPGEAPSPEPGSLAAIMASRLKHPALGIREEPVAPVVEVRGPDGPPRKVVIDEQVEAALAAPPHKPGNGTSHKPALTPPAEPLVVTRAFLEAPAPWACGRCGSPRESRERYSVEGDGQAIYVCAQCAGEIRNA